MSEFDSIMDEADEVLFEAFGEAATVQRGAAAPVPVTVYVERGVVAQTDAYGRPTARVMKASFRNSEWEPKSGDVLVLASGTHTVEVIESDDGSVSVAVLYG